jgi:TATA-box binding protein (TBP) (component of TFIID and TFIIIB)
MISKFLQEIDLKKFKEKFSELGSVTVRRKGSKFRGFEWKMKDTAFYNQVTIGYEDAYSRKSIKIFGNGAIQVAGCSDLFDCRRILKQLSFILASVLELEAPPPVADADVKMINTNFSLNSSVNLNKIITALGSSANQARISYLDEQIEHYPPIIEGIERNLARSEATLLTLGPGGQYRRKVLDESIRQDKTSLEENVKVLAELIAERRALGEKMPEGKFKVTFDPDRYSAVKVKFVPGQGMKQVTASIFSTGKIIVTGAQTLDEIAQAYKILNQNLDSTIFVKPVANPELFGTVMGATFEEWVRVLTK